MQKKSKYFGNICDDSNSVQSVQLIGQLKWFDLFDTSTFRMFTCEDKVMYTIGGMCMENIDFVGWKNQHIILRQYLVWKLHMARYWIILSIGRKRNCIDKISEGVSLVWSVLLTGHIKWFDTYFNT